MIQSAVTHTFSAVMFSRRPNRKMSVSTNCFQPELAQIYWEITLILCLIVVWAAIYVLAVADVDVDLEVRREHVHASELLAALVEGLDHADGLRHTVTIARVIAARLLRVFHF